MSSCVSFSWNATDGANLVSSLLHWATTMKLYSLFEVQTEVVFVPRTRATTSRANASPPNPPCSLRP